MFRLESSNSCYAEDTPNASTNGSHSDCLEFSVCKKAGAPTPGHERPRRPDHLTKNGGLCRIPVRVIKGDLVGFMELYPRLVANFFMV